jgi:hypothetical protein
LRARPALIVAFIVAAALTAFAQQLPHDDEVRLAEGIHLAQKVQDKIWQGWSKAPFGILLTTQDGEFLINHPLKPGAAPEGFTKSGHSELLQTDVWVRPRKFPLNFQATFPALGDGVPVIVVGEPKHTESKTSTPWVITLLHEHFHQLQYSRPGYQDAVNRLDLAKGDTSGMWMLNFPFPYEKKEVIDEFNRLKASLLDALDENDNKKFKDKAKAFAAEDSRFQRLLSPEEARYFNFQLWQEGVARYTQIKVAEAARDFEPSAQFKTLSDYESFADYAKHARKDTENELRQADLAKWQRVVVYSYGACEALLLDRINPNWQREYFSESGLSLDKLLQWTR